MNIFMKILDFPPGGCLIKQVQTGNKAVFLGNFDGMLKGLEKTRGRMQDYEDQTGRRVSRNHKKEYPFL